MENSIVERWSLMDRIGQLSDELMCLITEIEGKEKFIDKKRIIQFILNKVCERHGVEPQSIRGESQKWDFIKIRHEYVYLCDKYPVKFTKSSVMEEINRHGTTYYNSLYSFQDLIDSKDVSCQGFRYFQTGLYKRISRRDFE
jgi:hypothetical protein